MIYFNIIRHLRLGPASSLLPLGFLIKIFCVFLTSPIGATCHTHLILLDFTVLIVSEEEHPLRRHSLRNFRHPLLRYLPSS